MKTSALLASALLALLATASIPTNASGPAPHPCPEALITEPAAGNTYVYSPLGTTVVPSPDGRTRVASTVGIGIPWTVHTNCVWGFELDIKLTRADGSVWTSSMVKHPLCVHSDTSDAFHPPAEYGLVGGDVELTLHANPNCQGATHPCDDFSMEPGCYDQRLFDFHDP